MNPLGFVITNRGKKGEKVCIYTGNFEDGMRHGIGKIICADGRTYEGEWKRDQRSGQGTMHLVAELDKGDASRMHIGGVDGLYRPYFYSGQWESSLGRFAGIPHGRGQFGYCDGVIHQGNFNCGILLGKLFSYQLS